MVYHRYRSDSNLFLIELETGKEVLLTPHKGPGNFDAGYFSPDGQTIYLISNKDRELTALAKIQLSEDGQPGPIEVIAGRFVQHLKER